jgi:hypothetical protein
VVVGYMPILYTTMSAKHEAPPVKSTMTALRRQEGARIPRQVRVENAHSEAITIAFAVTVTGCGPDPITEGAAVLKHSIHLASVHGNLGGRYGYKMYAIYHPDGERCAAPLKDLGYELLKRETPVAVKDIEGAFLRSKIEKNGCCGEKELVKLEGENDGVECRQRPHRCVRNKIAGRFEISQRHLSFSDHHSNSIYTGPASRGGPVGS